MLAAIDSGNTNVVFAVYDGDELRGEWRSSSDANRTADEYAVWLSHLMNLEDLSFEDIDETIIANVVPAAFYALRMLCRRYFKCVPLVIGDDEVDRRIIHPTLDSSGLRAVDRIDIGCPHETRYQT